MENDEITLDVQEETQEDEAVAVEETEAEETQEESTEAKLAKAEAEAAKYRRLFEKSQKPAPAKATEPQATPQLNVEEVVLLANGMDEELLTRLKKVAQVNNTSLIKAQNDPIFIAVKEQFEKDKKKEDASLPAARGSGAVKAKKDTTTPGLSRDEHMKLAREAAAKL